MARILVLYHSMYGHIEAMAQAVAEGAREVAGAQVDLKRVPETMSPEAFAASYMRRARSRSFTSPSTIL